MTEEDNPLGCLYINKGSARTASEEYAAEYWADLAQQKADVDAERGAKMRVRYYVMSAIRGYQQSLKTK